MLVPCPVVLVENVRNAIVKTTWLALPELDLDREDSVAAPVRRPRHDVGELLFQLLLTCGQHSPVCNFGALLGNPCPELGTTRPDVEVLV